MLSFNYVARDVATGRHVKAEVQAEDEQAAVKLIRSEGLVPLDVKLSKDTEGSFSGRFKRIHSKDKVLFSRQLATLINAGLPLVQSLRNVNMQTTSKPLKVVINRIVSDVEAGTPLAIAMGKYPTVFGRVYVSLVAAGETSGTLDAALERVANQQEKDADIISKVRGALIYPLIVLLVMAAVVIFMLVKVLPQVQVLYRELKGATLPLPTRMLLAVSYLLTHYWWIVVVVTGVLIFFGSKWGRSATGKRAIDRLKTRTWPVGTLFTKMYMARFTRTAATLVASGVPLIQVLEITGDAVDNIQIRDSVIAATEKVKAGKSLGEALQRDPNFPELVPNMLRIGEESGSMEQMLGKTADYYEKEVDTEIKAIQTIIEPVMMILMGLVAFTIVAAVLLPIYNLASQTGNIV